jgi:hypothetical protein
MPSELSDGKMDFSLTLLKDQVTMLRASWDKPNPNPRTGWISRDHLTVACGLLEELAARLAPPSAPATDATVGMRKLVQEVAATFRSLGAANGVGEHSSPLMSTRCCGTPTARPAWCGFRGGVTRCRVRAWPRERTGRFGRTAVRGSARMHRFGRRAGHSRDPRDIRRSRLHR